MKKRSIPAVTLIIVLSGTLLSCGSGGGDGVGDTDVVERFIEDANAGNYADLADYMLPTAQYFGTLTEEWWEDKIDDYIPLALEGYAISKATVTGALDSRFSFTFQEHEGNLRISKIGRYIDATTTETIFK